MQHFLLHRQYHIFFAVLIVTAIFFAVRVAHLLPLANAQTRTSAQLTLKAVAEREGWVLSDVIVDEVSQDRMRVTLRQHVRGSDPESCKTLMFKDFSMRACDD